MGMLSNLLGQNDAARGVKKGIKAQRQMFDIARSDLQPYRDEGLNYMSSMRDFMARGRPTAETIRATPGYQFRLDEGRRGVENLFNSGAGGGLQSGNAMRAIMEYGQNYATNEYDKEIARDEMDYGRLYNLLNMGYNAAGT